MCKSTDMHTHTHLHRQHHNLKKETYFLFEGIHIHKCLIFGAEDHVNSVLLYLQTMRLPYSSTDNLCDDHKGAEAVKKRKREMNMSLNQHQALPKHTMLPNSNHSMHIALVSITKSAFAIWYWCSFI